MATKTETLIQRYGRKAADVLADRSIPATQLAQMLTQAGYPISATVIKDYRRKQTNTTQQTEEEDTR
jgi:gp28